MFTSLRLRNFKSWMDTGPIRLAPVNAFFGTNSSGKTSIIQSLLLLRQTAQSPDRGRVLDLGGPAALVDLGTFDDIIWDHDHENTLSFALAWREDSPVEIVDPLQRSARTVMTGIASRDLGIESRIDDIAGAPSVEELTYRLGSASFSMHRRPDGVTYDLHSDHYTFVRSQGRAWPLPPPARFYGFPDQVRAYFQNASFLSDLELRFEQQLARVHYLGPLREDPKRQYIFSGGRPADVGRRGELAVDVLIAAQRAGIRASRGWTSRDSRGRRRRLASEPLDQLVAEWLEELGLISSFELETLDDRETLYRVSVRRSHGSAAVLLTDVGFGGEPGPPCPGAARLCEQRRYRRAGAA